MEVFNIIAVPNQEAALGRETGPEKILRIMNARDSGVRVDLGH
jgi:hypothetical protein